MRKHITLPLAALIIGLFVTGCALTQYGRLQRSDLSDGVTVQSLQKNWQNYEVFYSGQHAGHPSAVLFDRKDDDKAFSTERWFRVTNKELLDDLIDSIQRQLPIAGYFPRLWKVLGPDGHAYGYLFTAWDHAVLRSVDEKTLFVNDIPMPPYLAVEGDGKGFRTP